MRQATIFATILLALAAAMSPARAQTPDGQTRFYSGPTVVNLAGRPVIAQIALSADMEAAKRGDLRLSLITDVTEFISDIETDLENNMAARRQRCGERWNAGNTYIGFPQGAVRFALDVELEYWGCGWDGTADPSRVAHESGRVDVTLLPEVIDGALQARVADFSIDNRVGISRFLPLEFVVRALLDQEMQNLNKNPKFYRAPEPLFSEGFAYEAISADDSDGRVVITARYRARGDADAFRRIAAKMRSEGITQ